MVGTMVPTIFSEAVGQWTAWLADRLLKIDWLVDPFMGWLSAAIVELR